MAAPCRSAATRLVVGAPLADVGGNADQGAAYVFYRNQGGADAWGQVAKLTAADGARIDVSAARVGQRRHGRRRGARGPTSAATPTRARPTSSTGTRAGADAWGQVAKLTAADGRAGLLWLLRVGQRRHGRRRGCLPIRRQLDQGAAYVFYRNQGGADAWGQVAKLTASDGAAGGLLWPLRIGRRQHGHRRREIG